jgi:glycosyltransferase involved in cell wall biosynthesis
MNKPLVTVITPAYNCGKFIWQTMESVLTQDYGSENIQSLLIDDASTDDTKVVLNRAGFKPDGYIHHMTNQGEQRTVNEGLRLVKGKYFIVLNGDDVLLPRAISHLVAFMESHPDVLCAYPDWDSINEDGSFRAHHQTQEFDLSYMVRHNTWPMSVGTIHKSDVIKLVGYHDESFKYLSDADYWLRIGLAGRIERVPETLACWRHRNGQSSQEKNRQRAQEHVEVIKKLYSGMISVRHRGLILIEHEALCWANLVAAAVTGSKSEMAGYVWKGIKLYPQVLLKLEFWETLAKRASYILRK